MNSKIFSVLVSCLLFSNFFIELQGKTLQGMGLQELRPYGGGLRSKRSACEPLLDLTLSAVDNTLIVRNTTSSKVLLIDTEQKVVLLLDGNSTSGVVINQETNESTLITDGLWNENEESLTEYLNSIKNNISSLSDQPKGVDFTLPQVPLEVLQVTSLILEDLVVSSVDPKIEQYPEVSLELVLSIALSIEDILEGRVDGLLEQIGNQQIELAVDISGVANILKALEVILNAIQISIRELIKKYDNLDIGPILGARDGLSALSQVLRQLGETDVDLSPLDEILGDPEQLTKLIAKLGGEQSYGITGAFRVAGEIIALANGSTTLDRVITILITVVAQTNLNVNDDLNGILQNSLINLLEILEKNNPQTLEGLVKIVKELLTKEFIVDEVNISDIISIILASAVQPKEELLSVVVNILKSLDPIVEPSESIPALLVVIIVQLDSAAGVRTLVLLGLELDSDCACSLLEISLASAANLTETISIEIYDVCSRLPIISNIIVTLEVIISAENLSLEDLLKASELAKKLIVGVFQLVGDIELAIEQEILEESKELISNCNDLYTLVEIDITVSISVIGN
ncbi:unnamed protein product [Ceutorhynchus assimilis]|uniref:Uncharacterized protein n=1 Tax=Ceutorhynchus assimilis TaxID=467358 RepID=A0A9P0DFD1_9CUCU|nr:unnamed protein product [Ceutorhynchus assimilis]